MARSNGRLRRARFTARMLSGITASPGGSRLLRAARTAGLGTGLDWLAGFRRIFPSLEAARACATTYLAFDHSHPDSARVHLKLAERLRPSDYPVLFHLQNIGKIGSVFDLGGNVGNLFYSYRRYLPALHHVEWRVYDIPAMTLLGEALARERQESHLRFTNDLTALAEADLVLASGSLHYFEESMARMLARTGNRPKHVLINRTPLLEGRRSAITVQDGGAYLTACKMHSRDALRRDMQALGYQCIDEWTAPELALKIPCRPELSIPCYSGLYFRFS
jgi:putative methyltransferase (TIGR04325 family)